MYPSPKIPKLILAPIFIFGAILVILFILWPLFPPEYFFIKHPNSNQWPFIIPIGHRTIIPFIIGWIFEGARHIKDPLLFGSFFIAIYTACCAILYFFQNTQKNTLPNSPSISKNLLFLIPILSFCLFFIFRISPDLSAIFADAAVNPERIAKELINESSSLNDYFFIFTNKILGIINGLQDPILAIQLSVAIFGALFIGSMAIFAYTVGKDWFEKLLLFCGISTGGYSLMFFGHLETTALELAVMAIFFSVCALYIKSSYKLTWLYVCLLCLPLAVIAHAGGILLTISIPLLIGTFHRNNWIKTVKSLLLPRHVCAIVLAVILPALIIFPWRYFSHGDIGNITGGGDHKMFIPLFNDNVGLGLRSRPFYSLFSAPYWSDIISAMLFASPFGIFLVFTANYIRKRYELLIAEKNGRLILILAVCSISSLLIPLFFHHDFGTYGDWNISATYLFPLNIFAWTYFVQTTQRFQRSGTYIFTVSFIISVQLLMASSLYTQAIYIYQII